MKTALQELIERLADKKDEHEYNTTFDDGIRRGLALAIVKATELLEKEREQIENAWLNGVGAWDSEMEAEQYYNETFKR